ncbi:hypothetical protein KVR01_010228 [Diaporthe batatas]|uniref:uncharacterized protein n=1 Tax=Diaporthe batatas TaxID=748121 RepID=UPI001D03A80A|nr:uncharacterized protein KVR01_010228 [Diaporthe batatas]KAG8159591.1 hypothetical protein KVR01_010228 [Diaporthe batatas]
MSQRFSTDDVAAHNTPDSLWIIIEQNVYDVTEFQKDHPGGKKILQKFAGKDVSKQFRKFHTEASSILLDYKDDLQLGSLDVEEKTELPPTVQTVPEIAQPLTATA